MFTQVAVPDVVNVDLHRVTTERAADLELGIFAYYTLAYCHIWHITLPLRPLSCFQFCQAPFPPLLPCTVPV